MNITLVFNESDPDEKELLEWISQGRKKGTTIKRHLRDYKNLLDTLDKLERLSAAREIINREVVGL